jgi:hypothetical protein
MDGRMDGWAIKQTDFLFLQPRDVRREEEEVAPS